MSLNLWIRRSRTSWLQPVHHFTIRSRLQKSIAFSSLSKMFHRPNEDPLFKSWEPNAAGFLGFDALKQETTSMPPSLVYGYEYMHQALTSDEEFFTMEMARLSQQLVMHYSPADCIPLESLENLLQIHNPYILLKFYRTYSFYLTTFL